MKKIKWLLIGVLILSITSGFSGIQMSPNLEKKEKFIEGGFIDCFSYQENTISSESTENYHENLYP